MDWHRYDWTDVELLPVPDVPAHVAQIAYSPEFQEAMSYFRAVAAKHELSERVLSLTRAVIELNPAHYSVWDYRLEICAAIGNSVFDYKTVGLTPESRAAPPIGEDGDWLNEFAISHAKNYQVWNYRQHLLDAANPLWYRNERLVVQMVLQDDAKNFHAWSHLKWCVMTAAKSCPTAFEPHELRGGTSTMLEEDVLNNSVWSFRYFLLQVFPELRDSSEVAFVFDKIAEAEENESAWSYLSGIIDTIPGTKDSASARAKEFTSARAVEFLAVNVDPTYFDKLVELEPARQQFWSQNARLMPSQ